VRRADYSSRGVLSSVCVCVGFVCVVCVCVCVCVFFINSMPHYTVILHASGLNNYNMVTYNIYNLNTISSIVYSYSNFKSGSLT
jgi:hypothetical protein